MAYCTTQRVIALADRGLLSLVNLEELQAMTTPGGPPLELILAVPGSRHHEFGELLELINQPAVESKEAEIVRKARWQGLGLLIAPNTCRPHEQT